MRLTRLERHSVVLLTEMFLRRLHHLREVKHRDGGRWIRLRHLTGQSAGAAWESFRWDKTR